MSGITYAELLDGATSMIAAGADAVRTTRFDSRDAARLALRDFHAVLDAIETHTWTLIGPSRIAGISAATRSEPVVADAIGMVAGLRELVGADRPHPSTLELADRDWARAALNLRGATDLLSVHLDHWGRMRSPDASVLAEPAARDGALTRVARQLDAVLATETTLGLRCIQVGLSRAEVAKWLPDLEGNRASARRLIAPNRRRDASDALDGLRLIGEPTRTGDPVLHVADLIHRLRQAAWALRVDPDYSVATLSDLATAGLALHAHAAAALGADLTRNPPASCTDAAPFVAAAATWRDVRVDLTAYRAPGPADRTIRSDVLALRDLLPDLAPLDGTPPARPGARDLLVSGTRAAQEIASAAGDVFERLAASGHVRIQARLLTHDQLGDDDELIRAKVTGATVSAPPARWRVTTELWKTAAGLGEPTLAPVEQALMATTRSEHAHVMARAPLERSSR